MRQKSASARAEPSSTCTLALLSTQRSYSNVHQCHTDDVSLSCACCYSSAVVDSFSSELLGYVREENAPSAASVAASHAPSASESASGVHESIVPAANPVADEKMRRQMERLRESRGPSLLEQHQQRLADEAKRTGGAKSKAKSGWDRCVCVLTMRCKERERGSCV